MFESFVNFGVFYSLEASEAFYRIEEGILDKILWQLFSFEDINLLNLSKFFLKFDNFFMFFENVSILIFWS